MYFINRRRRKYLRLNYPGKKFVNIPLNPLGAGAAVLLSFFIVVDKASALGTNQLSAVQDTYVHAGNADSSFGTDAGILVKRSDSGNGDRHAYYQFDLSDLSGGVVSANFQVGIESANQAELSIYTSDDEAWSEGDMTWSTQLETIQLEADLPIDINGEYLTVDLTETVNEFITSGKHKFTLVVKADETTSPSLFLGSRESSTESRRPFLFYQSAVGSLGLGGTPESLPAAQDTYVSRGSPNENYGAVDAVLVKISSSGNGDRNGYYQFDLSSFSGGVDSARFEVGIDSDSGADLSVYLSDQDWDENKITWSDRLTPGSNTEVLSVDRSSDFLIVDITDQVNSYLASQETLLTLVVSADEVTSPSAFLSTRESGSRNDRPTLYVQSRIATPAFEWRSHYITAKDDSDDPNYSFAADYLNEVNVAAAELGTFGGWKDWSLGSTGFFRTELVNGNWMTVDPEGYAFISMGLNSVVPGGDLDLPADLNAFGINSMGSWSDESITGIPYTPRWNFLLSFKNTNDEIKAQYNDDDKRILPVFEPDFATFVNTLAQGAAAYKDDPYVFGHFADNEIPFHQEVQLLNSLTHLDHDSPQYVEADRWMSNKYGSNYDLDDITGEDEKIYMGHVADTYYKIVSEALRRYDPNHLVLGTRLHAKAKYNKYVFQAAGRYTDVLSVNYYNEWEPELSTAVKMWNDEAGIPFLITEFYTKAEDSGLDNSGGAGWLVENQQGRADFYENFTLKLLNASNNIGWHWFRLADDDGSNKGVYTEDLSEAYTLLQASMEKVARNVYSLRSALLTDTLDFEGLADYTPSKHASLSAENPAASENYPAKPSAESSTSNNANALSSGGGSIGWLSLLLFSAAWPLRRK